MRALTFAVVERRYHLLLGLRRARYWSTLRRTSFEAALVFRGETVKAGKGKLSPSDAT